MRQWGALLDLCSDAGSLCRLLAAIASDDAAKLTLSHQPLLKLSYYSQVVKCDDDDAHAEVCQAAATNDAVIHVSDDGDDGDDDGTRPSSPNSWM